MTTITTACKTCGAIDDWAFGIDIECHECGAMDRCSWSDSTHMVTGGTHDWARKRTDDGRCRVCGWHERAHAAREEARS